MAALYNEIDPFAAQWLRNLVAAGHIASGVVDERSIKDLAPADVAGPGQRHFFAGIAGWSLALRLAGVPDDADVWTGSCPCQGLSSAGKRLGFADPRHLWPAWFRLIRQCRPAVVFGEQVASSLGWTWLDLVFADLEGEGYACAAADLPACGIGAPHRRQRLFFVAYADGESRRLLTAQRQPGRADVEAERRGEADRLANAERAGLEVLGEQQARREQSAAQRGGSTLGVADTAGERRDGLPRNARSRRRQSEPAGRSKKSSVGHSDGNAGRRSGRGLSREEASDGGGALRGSDHRSWAASNDDGSVADPTSDGRSEGVDGGQAGADRGAGPAHGGWEDCDWIPCSDGVSRPVEPGTRPLVTGLPGRVGLLRGYGNAISPPIAAAFIRAALEAG